MVLQALVGFAIHSPPKPRRLTLHFQSRERRRKSVAFRWFIFSNGSVTRHLTIHSRKRVQPIVTAGILIALQIGGILFLGTTLTQANTVNLSTGLDPSDTLITVGNTADAHWTVSQAFSSGSVTGPAKVVDATEAGGAFGPWAANGPGSSWITVNPNIVGNGSPLPLYERTFSLSAADLATAAISGFWGIDDEGEVRLNGYLLSSSLGNYSVTAPFSAAAGSGFFVAGVNRLTITMTSSDNYLEAVRLEGSLTTGVPDSGSTLLLLNAGVLGLAACRRWTNRRASQVG